MVYHYYESPLEIVTDALKMMAVVWQVTLALCIPFLITLALNSPFKHSGLKFSRKHLCIVIPIVMTVLMTIAGSAVMASYKNSPSPTPSWISGGVLLLLPIQFVACIWIVWFMRGYRLLSTFAVALQYWYALTSGYIVVSLLDNGP